MSSEPLTAINSELLASFLLYPNYFEDYAEQLHESMFPGYEWAFNVMKHTYKEEGLTFKGVVNRIPVTMMKSLQELRKLAFNENRIPHLVKSAKEFWIHQQVRELLHEWNERIEVDAPDELLRSIQEKSFEIFSSDGGGMSDSVKDVDGFIDGLIELSKDPAKAYGLLTEIPALDKLTTGWHRKDFSVVGARTSMGKSAFVIELALRIHRRGHKVAIFSLEMIKKQIYTRMMSNMLNVSAQDMRLGRLPETVLHQAKKRKEELYGMYVDDTRGVDAEYISDIMRRLKKTQGLDFVVVDYLQDVKEKGEQNDNSGSALARVCRKLRKAAQECDCHVMGLSQVTRATESQQDKRPGNADLSGSTGIETSADVIALLYREDYYNPDTDRKNILEVNFTKQRNGDLGRVELYFDRKTQRIHPLGQ